MTTPDSEVEHTHDHEHKSALRARSIEAPLIENGLLTADIVDRIVRVFEEDIGPLNGAKIVAHAWSDPVYRHRLLQDGNAAIAELGFQLPQKLVVLENSAAVPNVFVSHCAGCYPCGTRAVDFV